MNARKKATTPRAAAKKRLGPAHVVLLVITIILGLVAATMTTLAVMRAREVHAVRSEAAQTRQEANDFYATHWCNRIAPTMRERIARHYKEYLRATPEQRSAVDAACPGNVATASVIAQFKIFKNIEFSDYSCSPNADSTAFACTIDVAIVNEDLIKRLPEFSSFDMTITTFFKTDEGNPHFSPDFKTTETVTMTFDAQGHGTAQFETKYQKNWGANYALSISDYYPNV